MIHQRVGSKELQSGRDGGRSYGRTAATRASSTLGGQRPDGEDDDGEAEA